MTETFVTEEKIRETLISELDEGETSKRELMRSIIPTRADSNTTGSILYTLSGSPPRGYAIYTPKRRQLNYYAVDGSRLDYQIDVDGIAEIDTIIQRVVAIVQEKSSVTVGELTEMVEVSPTVRGASGHGGMPQKEGIERAVVALKSRGVLVENTDNGALDFAF